MRLTEEEFARLKGEPKRKRSKHGNVRVGVVDARDSKREDARYQELKLLLAAGEIEDLKHHVTFSLHVNGVHICDYQSDFTYKRNGKEVVEDAKGQKTRLYIIKRALMYACHGIAIRET